MRIILLLACSLSLGCRANRVLTIASVPTYMRGETVQTVEGYPLRRADGGKLAPAPHPELCLTKISQTEVSFEGKPHQVDVLGAEPGWRCGRHAVSEPETVLSDGEAITILGPTGGVQVSAGDVRGLRVIGADNGSAPWAPKTKLNSPGLLVAGSVITGLGVTGLVGSLVGSSQQRSSGSMDFSGFPYLIGMVLSVHVAAAGVPLIAAGAAPVRAPEPR